MKKILLVCALIFSLALAAPALSARTFAAPDENVGTEIFLPTSYLQYYRLDSPYAVCRYEKDGEEFVAISHKNAIVLYADEKFSSIDITGISNGRPVTVMERYGDYLLFLSDSEIYSIDVSDFGSDGWAETPKDTNIYCSFGFSVQGDVLLTNTNTNVYYNRIDTAAADFALAEAKYASIPEENTFALLASRNGKTYYSTNTGTLYEYDVGNSTKRAVVSDVQGVRCIAESGSGSDGKIYYSCNNGVYAVDPETSDVRTIFEIDASNTSQDLGNLLNPTGICLTGNGLWVVDGTINAVQEIDLADNSFTQFAITTNSSAVNRLTAEAKDLCVDKDKIYALDEGRIVVINDIDGENTYNRILLGESGTVNKFAAGGGYVLYAVGNGVKLIKTKDVGEPDLESEVIKVIDKVPSSDNDFDNIEDICYSENVFYILRNKLENGERFPEIYTLDCSTLEAEKYEISGMPSGVGVQITADIFGAVYFAVRTSSEYEFYSYGGGTLEKVYSVQRDRELKNIQTDFDGKIYALYEGNAVDCYDGGEKLLSKTLSLSSNLAGVGEAKSLCLSCNSEIAYFIFSGLILKSGDPDDLAISTPKGIAVPDGFGIYYDKDRPFATLRDGAKMFLVDVSNAETDYFDFLGYETSVGDKAGRDYAAINLGGKYTLLICDKTAAIVRTADINSTFTAQEKSEGGYALVAFSTYSIPVLSELYEDGEAEKYSLLTVVGEVTFNGRDYYAVDTGETTGYIPCSFITSDILSDVSSETLTSGYVYDRYGVTVYGERQLLTETDRINSKTRVVVLENYGGVAKIFYDGKVGYVKSEYIISDSTSNVLKALIVITVALSLMITALFLEDRYLYGEEKFSAEP